MWPFKKKKPEQTPAFRRAMAEKIARNRLRYASEREGDMDIVIGRDGGFNIRNGELVFLNTAHFKYGDTFQISNSLYNDGVYVYGEAGEFEDEENVLITKVVYPRDVVMGVVNLFKWDAENRDKVGVKSESLSRYSVTYYDISSNAEVGFPNGLVAFLKPYMRAKF